MYYGPLSNADIILTTIFDMIFEAVDSKTDWVIYIVLTHEAWRSLRVRITLILQKPIGKAYLFGNLESNNNLHLLHNF